MQRRIDLRCFPDGASTVKALLRMASHNTAHIEEVSLRNLRIVLKDGSRLYFRTLRKWEDCTSISGIAFCTVDIHPDIEERFRRWVLSRVRGMV